MLPFLYPGRGISAFNRTWCGFYVGYQALDIDFSVKSRDSADVKFAAICEFMMGYVETAGNDALRGALVEAFGLGIASAGGRLDLVEEAQRYVMRAREVKQLSTDLEAASRALGLIAEGKPAPRNCRSSSAMRKTDRGRSFREGHAACWTPVNSVRQLYAAVIGGGGLQYNATPDWLPLSGQ